MNELQLETMAYLLDIYDTDMMWEPSRAALWGFRIDVEEIESKWFRELLTWGYVAINPLHKTHYYITPLGGQQMGRDSIYVPPEFTNYCTGYTIEEIRRYQHALATGNVHRLVKIDVTPIIRAISAACEELNAALLQAMHRSNHDGRWN